MPMRLEIVLTPDTKSEAMESYYGIFPTIMLSVYEMYLNFYVDIGIDLASKSVDLTFNE
jgi:hypothetical protein